MRVLGIVFAVTASLAVAAAAMAQSGSPALLVGLVKTTFTDADGASGPSWMIGADREMLVDATSEASVAACEDALSKGASACAIPLGPCVSLIYSDAPIVLGHRGATDGRIQLSVDPTRCHTGDEPLRWTTTRNGAPDSVIPVDGPR